MGLQNVDPRIKVITLFRASAHSYERSNSLIPRNLDGFKEPKRATGKGTLYYQPNNKILTTEMPSGSMEWKCSSFQSSVDPDGTLYLTVHHYF